MKSYERRAAPADVLAQGDKVLLKIRGTPMRVAAAVMIGAAVVSARAWAGEGRPYEGARALVVEPENSWGWDSALFGALEERGFEVGYGRIAAHAASLSQFDLVALSIRRSLAPAEEDLLRAYVSEGGAVYGSWGGPFGASGFLRDVCKVGGIRSVRVAELMLLESPLTRGIGDRKLLYAERVGHTAAKAWEVVTLEALPGALPVARDAAGRCAGVLSQVGRGRAAVLGFGPEQEKFLANPALGPALLDNLLAWLLEGRPAGQRGGGSNRVAVALPRRAEVLEVHVGGKPAAKPRIREVGSQRKVELDVAGIAEGQEFDVRITYKPLADQRNVETVIHLPWNTLRAAAASPARLAEYLKSLNATACQPLLRGSFGEAWYRGMAEDKPDEKLVTQYAGDFLADLIGECHQRRIKVIGGLYFDNAAPIRKYPELKRLDRQGREVKDSYGRFLACFNHPKGQEYNLATIENLLTRYRLDGIVLDDNFELDKNDCHCSYCKEQFKSYCQAKKIAWQDPVRAAGEVLGAWRDYRRQATRDLARNVKRVAQAHGVPAGGWVGVGMDATHLAGALDFLGGMVYTESPRAARGPLSVLGGCGFIGLLWAPGTSVEALELEAREAVHAGCPAIGFWVRGDDGGYRMDDARGEAIRRAFGRAEEEWLSFYRNSILSGDRRFILLAGRVGRVEMRLTLRNAGGKPGPRRPGPLDLDALRARNGGTVRKTEVSIRGDAFCINGRPTYEGRTWQGHKIEGLLLNSRMVQGIFDDLNPETRSRWAYPDTGTWDPERNTREFVAAMPEWRRHGLLAFTLNLQGGSPQGYSRDQPWHNSALTETGDLRPEYLARLERILDRADELGMAVILGLFYFGQDHRLKDEAAVQHAVDTALDWLFDRGYRNVLIEINNECDVRYDHAILQPPRVHELIERAKARTRGGRRFLVSTSYGGGAIPRENVVRSADFLLIHGNGVGDAERIAEMVRRTRRVPGYRPMPILFNEDDHFDFERPRNNFVAAVGEYCSWGYFDPGASNYRDGYQCPPVQWGITGERKRAFFAKLREITGE